MSSISLKLGEFKSQVQPRSLDFQGARFLGVIPGRRCFLLDYADKTLVCRDCGQEFTFTGSEQAFYAEKGFANEPTRCRDCRAKRKATMNGPKQMFDITCSNCGQPGQVPFEPKGDRPVLCANCFKDKRPA